MCYTTVMEGVRRWSGVLTTVMEGVRRWSSVLHHSDGGGEGVVQCVTQ